MDRMGVPRPGKGNGSLPPRRGLEWMGIVAAEAPRSCIGLRERSVEGVKVFVLSDDCDGSGGMDENPGGEVLRFDSLLVLMKGGGGECDGVGLVDADRGGEADPDEKVPVDFGDMNGETVLDVCHGDLEGELPLRVPSNVAEGE